MVGTPSTIKQHTVSGTMGLYRSPHQVLYLSNIPVEMIGFEPIQHTASVLQTDITRHRYRISIKVILRISS